MENNGFKYSDLPIDELILLAQQGDPIAQHKLAKRYEKGRGAEKRISKAIYWYTQAALQGFAKAQNSLGVCYIKGKGIKESRTNAVNLFAKAAEQGLLCAQCNLG